MTELIDLTVLSNYKAWADKVFYQVMSELSGAQLHQSRPMLYDNLFQLMHHSYSMDIVWKSHLIGQPHHFETRNPASTVSFNQLRDNQQAVNQWYLEFTSELHADQYQTVIEFAFIGEQGRQGRMTIFEIIQHVVNHGTYHRGHIEGVLYQMGIEPPTTDLPVYLRSCRCQADSDATL